MDWASGGWIAEGWSTDSCKNFFGQLIVSNERAFQSTLKMQASDNRRQFQFTEEHVYFGLHRMTWPRLSWNIHRTYNFEVF